MSKDGNPSGAASGDDTLPPAGAEIVSSKAEILERLVKRARELVPALRERAARADEMRQLPRETIEELVASGLFRVFRPARYGGYELDYGPAQLRLAGELGRGCGSSAWVYSVIACHSWVLGMFPGAAQDDVWGASPDALIVAALYPERCELEPVGGGFRLSGHWKFASGVDFADWAILGAVRRDGEAPETVWCVVPRRDYRIDDTWFVGGLRGTGSNDIRTAEAFVPEHRVAPLRLLSAGKGPGAAINSAHIYRLPLLSVFPYNICAPALGIARGALEQFIADARRAPTSPRGRAADREATQLQVAEAAVQIDCAMSLLDRDGEEINRRARAGVAFMPEHRARYRRDLSHAGRLCMRAVDILHYLAGAHGLFEENPLQRAFRDVHAANAQLGLRWDNNALDFGRIALGLPLRDPML